MRSEETLLALGGLGLSPLMCYGGRGGVAMGRAVGSWDEEPRQQRSCGEGSCLGALGPAQLQCLVARGFQAPSSRAEFCCCSPLRVMGTCPASSKQERNGTLPGEPCQGPAPGAGDRRKPALEEETSCQAVSLWELSASFNNNPETPP